MVWPRRDNLRGSAYHRQEPDDDVSPWTLGLAGRPAGLRMGSGLPSLIVHRSRVRAISRITCRRTGSRRSENITNRL